MDPTENKDKFSTGFREVQESFYDLCGKLEKTQDCFLNFHWRIENFLAPVSKWPGFEFKIIPFLKTNKSMPCIWQRKGKGYSKLNWFKQKRQERTHWNDIKT